MPWIYYLHYCGTTAFVVPPSRVYITHGLALECITTIPHCSHLFATICALRLDQHAHTLEQQLSSPESLGCIIYDSKLHLTACLQTACLIRECETHHPVPVNIRPVQIRPVLASTKYPSSPTPCPEYDAPFSYPKDAEGTIEDHHAS